MKPAARPQRHASEALALRRHIRRLQAVTMSNMSPTPFLFALLLTAAAWWGVDQHSKSSRDADQPTPEMNADTAPNRPAIDLQAPADFQTATFALG